MPDRKFDAALADNGVVFALIVSLKSANLIYARFDMEKLSEEMGKFNAFE